MGAAATRVCAAPHPQRGPVNQLNDHDPKDPGQRAGTSEAEHQEKLAQLVQKRSMLSPDEVALLNKAFGTIVRAHHDYVWELLRRRGLQSHEAEDILQETFIALHGYIVANGFVDSIPGMLHSLARGKLLNHVRANKRSPLSIGLPSSGSEKGSQPDFERLLHYQDIAQRIFSQLSPEHQDVIDTVIIRGLTHADAAAELGVPEGTLKSRLLAAKRSFIALAEPLLTPSQRESL